MRRFAYILPSKSAQIHCGAGLLLFLRKPDLDARWVKKNGVSHYHFKNSICIDVDHGFIRRYVVTPANVHDSQMLPSLLDTENEHDFVWADSEYSGESFKQLLSLGGFESLIHEKGARNH